MITKTQKIISFFIAAVSAGVCSVYISVHKSLCYYADGHAEYINTLRGYCYDQFTTFVVVGTIALTFSLVLLIMLVIFNYKNKKLNRDIAE